jgi:hypothetical protein
MTPPQEDRLLEGEKQGASLPVGEDRLIPRGASPSFSQYRLKIRHALFILGCRSSGTDDSRSNLQSSRPARIR